MSHLIFHSKIVNQGGFKALNFKIYPCFRSSLVEDCIYLINKVYFLYNKFSQMDV
jgi:hypothetical protein